MKKNISINLQGLIFHIEEDGYEQLRQYLAAIKTYFSNYAGHEEIVADIEGRIAEVFSGKLNPGKQVITQEDVQALITQMGSVQDFASIEEEEDLNQPYSSAQQTTGAYHQTHTHTNTHTQTDSSSSQSQSSASTGPKRLYRDVNRKVISGVSAGIGNYLGIDAIWIRLVFVFFFLLGVFTAGISAGFVGFIYVLCWLALPKSYTLAEINAKKLFRDSLDKKLGGVCSGLSLYFGMDVGVVRLLFLLSVLFGGLGIPIYIVLWLVVPLATTITDRVQMQGNPITLSGIEESLKNNLRMSDENGQESSLARVLLFPVRLVAQVLEVVAKALKPLVSFLGSAIRIFAGIILLLISLSFIFALFVGLGAGSGLINDQYFLGDFDGPMQLFARDFPGYGMVGGFLAGLIPSLFLLMIAVGLLTKRFYLKPLVGWSLFAVWVVSLFTMGSAIFVFRQNFNERGEYITEKIYPVENLPTVQLNARNASTPAQRWINEVEFNSVNNPNIRVVQEFRAKGRTEDQAIQNAKMLDYRIQQRDSTLIFDRQARINSGGAFRDQELSLKIYLPQNKKFRLNQEFVYLASNYFDKDYDFEKINLRKSVWEFRDDKFTCATCPEKVEEPQDEETGEMNDVDIADIDIKVLDGDLIRAWDDYGSEEKTFNFTEFENVEVGGAYHVRLTKGDNYQVRARGDEEGIKNLKATKNGSTVEFRSDENFWDFTKNNRETVLIEVTMPHLKNVDLSGAVKSDISGFEEDKCEISQSGAVQTNIGLNASRLTLDLSGAAKTTIAGRTDELQLTASGACNVQAGNLRAKVADVNLSGASKANIFVTEKLTADASGVSNIKYRGNPTNVTTDVSGASKVQR